MVPEYRKHIACEKLNVFSMLVNVTPGIIAPRIWMAHKTCIYILLPSVMAYLFDLRLVLVRALLHCKCSFHKLACCLNSN